MIGENIRQARLSQDRSLADVAKKAKISVATLSRIENDKQTLELGLFLTLARILDRTPQDLLADLASEGTGLDPLVRRIAGFEAVERARFWRELATAQRTHRAARTRRLPAHQIAQQVDELLAQMDFLRDELENVRKRLRRSTSR
jgi:transcriptional regulator with XRE-family HTH domain